MFQPRAVGFLFSMTYNTQLGLYYKTGFFMKKIVSSFALSLLMSASYSANNIPAKQYDSGVTPAVALSENTIVEAHHTSNGFTDTLWYHVGKINNDTIEWGKSYKYDTGLLPAVAFHDNLVVETHVSTTKKLWYRVGLLNPGDKTIAWGMSQHYDQGFTPSITLVGNTVVVVYERGGFSRTLFYRTGTLDIDNRHIQWNDPIEISKGRNASVASQSDTLVLVNASAGKLWYRTGKLSGNAITWNEPVSYGTGNIPSVTFSGNTLVEMHDATMNNRLWYQLGALDANDPATIHWGKLIKYNTGTESSLSLYENTLVEVHTSDNFAALYSNLGIVNNALQSIDWVQRAKAQ